MEKEKEQEHSVAIQQYNLIAAELFEKIQNSVKDHSVHYTNEILFTLMELCLDKILSSDLYYSRNEVFSIITSEYHKAKLILDTYNKKD